MLIEMTARTDLVHRIRHAESYPFARPACSYLFADGAMRPLPKDACRHRLPVMASGSNASPDRLAAKFGTDDAIPVTRATLHGFAVVFAGHFTAYGAVPATLCPWVGVHSGVWITWLTPTQLATMHRSEGVIGCREAEQRYDYIEMRGIDLRPERMAPVQHAGAYLSRRMLAPEGKPIRFAEVLSKGSDLEARSHPSALRLAKALLHPGASFADFMSNVLSDKNRRQALFQQMTPYTMDRPSGLVPGAADASVHE